MQCRITTLAENCSKGLHFIGEHGWSVLIEADGMNILFDTGEGYTILHNADLLDVDLTKADKLVISHSHIDHTGGLYTALKKIGKEIEVIAAPDLWAEKYVSRGGEKPRYVGIPFVRGTLESLGARFTLTQEPVQLTNNVMTTGEIPIVTDFEKVGEDYLLAKVGDEFVLDNFPDDRAVIIKTEAGLVVVLGCAHRCLINTLYHAQKLTGIQQIYMVIGGCHLVDASEERIMKTIAALEELDVKKVGVSHCTGLRASVMMAHELGDRFFFNNAGNRVDIP